MFFFWRLRPFNEVMVVLETDKDAREKREKKKRGGKRGRKKGGKSQNLAILLSQAAKLTFTAGSP